MAGLDGGWYMSEFLQALDAMRGEGFQRATTEVSYASWLPYLELNPPNPNSGIESEDIKSTKEIYEYFKGVNPEKPFEAFLEELKLVPVIGPESKVKTMLKVVRLKKQASLFRFHAERIENDLRKMA